MSDQIRAAVETILTEARVTFKAEYRGERKKALGGDRAMDEWLCEFTFAGRPNEPEEFEFFTGLGLRKLPLWTFGAPGYDGGPKPRHGTLAWEKRQKAAKPKAPHAADVLHSLILDSSAADQSFESWCGDFGYDTDSRKAYATYEACQKNADKLRSVIDRATLERLSEALQEY